jgi:hypothetical protein
MQSGEVLVTAPVDYGQTSTATPVLWVRHHTTSSATSTDHGDHQPHSAASVACGDHFAARWHESHPLRVDAKNFTTMLQPGVPAVLPASHPNTVNSDGFVAVISTRSTLAAVRELHANGPLLLDHTIPPSQRALRQWQDASQMVGRAMVSLADPVSHPDASRVLAQAVLALYPPQDQQLGFALTTPD